MSKWETKTLKGFVKKGGTLTSSSMKDGDIPVVAGGLQYAGYHNAYNRNENCITVSASGANAGAVRFHKTKIFATDCSTVIWNGEQSYLYYELLRRQNQIFQMQTGLAQPHIYPKDIEKLEICYPTDIAEQRKIAEVLSTIDETIEKTAAIIEKYSAIKRGLMQSLLVGELVYFSKVAKSIIGLTYKPADIEVDGIPVLRSNNILDSKINDKNIVRVTTKIQPNLFLKKNDILMCSRNGSEDLVGKVGFVDEVIEPTTFGAFMTVIRSPINNYLFYWFQTNDFRKQIIVGCSTTIFQVTQIILKKLLIPLPTEDKIQKISEQLSAIDKKIETERNYLTKLFNIKKGLMHDLLTNKISVEPLLKEEAV